MISFFCFPHFLFVLLCKRADVTLTERTNLRASHYVSVATTTDDQFLCGLTTPCRFDLNQCAAIDNLFVDGFCNQFKLPVIERSAGRFCHLRDFLSQTLL